MAPMRDRSPPRSSERVIFGQRSANARHPETGQGQRPHRQLGGTMMQNRRQGIAIRAGARVPIYLALLTLLSFAVIALPAAAQSFRVQCPQSTITHPAASNNSEPAYVAPTYALPTTGANADYTTGSTGPVNGAIKCQQVGGGDGYASMADGNQTYMFSFGPLSG